MATHPIAPSQHDTAAGRLRRVWDRLTTPHPSLITIELRRQSRLLAALTFSTSILSFMASFALIARSDGRISANVIGVWIAVILTMGIYGLNRRGYYQTSARLFIGLNFVMIHFAPLVTDDPGWLLFAGMLMIIGAALLPSRHNITSRCSS